MPFKSENFKISTYINRKPRFIFRMILQALLYDVNIESVRTQVGQNEKKIKILKTYTWKLSASRVHKFTANITCTTTVGFVTVET